MSGLIAGVPSTYERGITEAVRRLGLRTALSGAVRRALPFFYSLAIAMRSPIPGLVKKERQDLTDYLWHFTRYDREPEAALFSILEEKTIRASNDRDTGGDLTRFTEAPLEQVRPQAPALRATRFPRFSLYGVGFSKKDVFRAGGLPVIYGKRGQLKDLCDQFKWRHVDSDLDEGKGIDYSWMREWRVNGDFRFTEIADRATVIAPDIGEFEGEVYEIIEDGDEIDREPVPVVEIYFAQLASGGHPRRRRGRCLGYHSKAEVTPPG